MRCCPEHNFAQHARHDRIARLTLGRQHLPIREGPSQEDKQIKTVVPCLQVISDRGDRLGARTALQDDGAGVEDLHDLGHDGFEQPVEGGVVRAILHGHVDAVKLSMALPDVLQVARPREEVVAVLVEAHRQHPAKPTRTGGLNQRDTFPQTNPTLQMDGVPLGTFDNLTA